MTDRDHQLDDRLRQVPLPSDLHAIVGRDRLFDEAAIDRLLGQVAVPAGLADRVRAYVERGTPARGVVDLSRFSADRAGGQAGERPTATGPMPEAATSDTKTALGATGIVPADPWRRRLNRTLKVAREAGTVAAALALTLLVAAVGIEVSRQLEGPPLSRRGPTAQRSTGKPTDSAASRQRGSRPQPTERGLDEGSATAMARAAGVPAGASADLAAAGPENRRNAVQPEDRSTAGRPERKPAEPTTVVRGAPVIAPAWQTPATMSRVAVPRATRRAIPRSPGFDLAFEMAHGEAPFVDPAAAADLAVDRPPLTLATEGFEALLQNGLGRRLRGQPIRVEDILAAMPPPPGLVHDATGPVRLGLHAVPSGRRVGGVPTLLLEAAVYAAGEPAPAPATLPLTLVIDQSTAGDTRAWPRICRGLAAVAARLEPTTRVSVVLCGPRPRLAIEDAEPAELLAASTAWARLPPAASADLDAGLELAAANRSTAGRTIVVAHTVTLDRGRATVGTALAEWHRALAAAGGDTLACTPAAGSPRLVIIDPAAPDTSSGREPTFGRTGSDSTSIRRELLRQATGRSLLVASQCRLEVQFDPAQVARYRIVGHRQSTVESLAAGLPSGIDLHAGETVRAVYEVVPRAGHNAPLGKAILTWRSDAVGPQRLEVIGHGRDARLQSSRLAAHERSLLLAAWLGELAGGSAHHGDGRSLLAVLGAVAEEWQAAGDLTPFGTDLMDLIDRRPRQSRGLR